MTHALRLTAPAAVVAALLSAALLCAGCSGPAPGTLLSLNTENARPETAPSNPASAPAPAAAAPSTNIAQAPASAPADDAGADEESDETAWKIITSTLERDGVRKDAVLAVTVPRDDLFVAIDGMDVPTLAGVESIFNFWHCSCGKTSVVGQFCVADYESNDVIDALRAGHMEVASIAPMVLHSKVSPLILRFQGEGKAGDLAKTLREALRWTGKERMAPDVPLKRGNN